RRRSPRQRAGRRQAEPQPRAKLVLVLLHALLFRLQVSELALRSRVLALEPLLLVLDLLLLLLDRREPLPDLPERAIDVPDRLLAMTSVVVGRGLEMRLR